MLANPEGEEPLGDVGVDGRLICNCLNIDLIVDCCEHGVETSGFVNGGESL